MVSALNLIGNNGQLQSHWLRRIIAAFFDGIIMMVIWFVISFIIAIGSIFIPGGFLLMPLFSGLLWLLYSGLMEGTSGATIGKRLVGLRVISIEGEMDIGKGFFRNITKIYGLFLLIDWIVGFIGDGDPRQRLLDRMANTTVIRTDVQEIIPGAFQPGGGPIPTPMPPGPPQPQYGASPNQPAQYQQPQQQPAPTQQSTSSQPTTPDAEKTESVAENTQGATHTRSDLVALRKEDIIKIARDKGLKVSGTKRDLIDRILGE